MAKVLFKRKTTDEIKNLEIQDGALIYNTDNGKTYMDFGEERIQTGGNADTMITIGGEEAPTDTDIKIWIKDKDNQNYNNFYYRNADNKFEQMFLQPTGDTLPIGSISAYSGENIPTNWLKCNGQALLRTDYPELFNAIGITYGSGDGSTTFNLPNISERVIVGNNGDGEFSLGNTGGEKEHTLTVNEMPSHYHGLDTVINGANPGDSAPYRIQTDKYQWGGTGVYTGTDSSGSSQPHNNMQPYIALNFIIKAKQSAGVVGTVTSDINDTSDNAVPNAKTVKDYADKVHILWTNPNPSSGMSEGAEINLSSNDYDMLVWMFCYSTASQNLSTHNMSACLKGANCHLNSIGYTTGATVRRLLNYSNDTKYISTAAIHSGGSDGTGYCIPLYCLGVKF